MNTFETDFVDAMTATENRLKSDEALQYVKNCTKHQQVLGRNISEFLTQLRVIAWKSSKFKNSRGARYRAGPCSVFRRSGTTVNGSHEDFATLQKLAANKCYALRQGGRYMDLDVQVSQGDGVEAGKLIRAMWKGKCWENLGI